MVVRRKRHSHEFVISVHQFPSDKPCSLQVMRDHASNNDNLTSNVVTVITAKGNGRKCSKHSLKCKECSHRGRRSVPRNHSTKKAVVVEAANHRKVETEKVRVNLN